MKNRMSRCAALIGSLLSLSSFAQVCQEVSLYSNGEAGKMEQAGMTFPEAPEWSANWGVMEGLTPPYIRWSGMKNRAGDWTGNLSLSNLPVTVRGGNLSFKVRVTQNAKFGIWLVSQSGSGMVKRFDLDANRTYGLEVPVSELAGAEQVSVKNVGVGLFGVPANQYTTLFVDDISFSCALSGNEAETAYVDGIDSVEYVYSDISPERPSRSGKFILSPAPVTSHFYTEAERRAISDSTDALIVVSEQEHLQMVRSIGPESRTPQESRDLWFRNMYFVDRNRLRDSVIANPKGLFYEAGSFSAAMEKQAMPLLLGNVDYAYRECGDTACATHLLKKARFLGAGLPSADINGSVLKVYYDPYFVSTNRRTLPTVEIYVAGNWQRLEPKSEMLLEMDAAGVQQIRLRLSEGGVTVNQNLFVEVK